MTIDNTLTHAASESPACPYCFVATDGESVTCPVCGAAHHADCYAEAGACAVYGCADSADRRDDSHQTGAGSAQPLPSTGGSSRAIAEALRASATAPPALPPPPVGATPVRTFPPPSGAAQAAPYRQPTSRIAPAEPAASPAMPQAASRAVHASAAIASGQSGQRRVVVGGTASATIAHGQLLVATSEGVLYQFQL